MTKVYPKPQSEGQFLTKSIQHVFVVGPWPFQIPMLGVWLWILYTISRETQKDQAIPSTLHTKKDHTLNPLLEEYTWCWLYRINHRMVDGFACLGAFVRAMD